MIKNAVFEDLKFGDKLAAVTDTGKIEFFTYLSRDPSWQDRYCFLMLSDGIHAIHYQINTIENEFFTYDNIKELVEYIDNIRMKYYRSKLKRLEEKYKKRGEK